MVIGSDENPPLRKRPERRRWGRKGGVKDEVDDGDPGISVPGLVVAYCSRNDNGLAAGAKLWAKRRDGGVSVVVPGGSRGWHRRTHDW